MSEAIEISFVIPCHNEAANLKPLVAAIGAAVEPLKTSYEIVITDDFSSDNSWSVLKELAAADPKIRAQKFAYNCGQSAALWAGMNEARSHGDNFVRIVSSKIANWVRNKLSGENISDAGCCYRAFKRECIADLKFFKGMHRFLPTLFKIEGFTVTEIPVGHNPRVAGASHYGVWNRLFASLYDLFAVRWMKRRMFKYKIAETIN
jgi:dolichol-phosphate mannosyltransferase